MKREIKYKAWIPKLEIWLDEIGISTCDNLLGVSSDHLEEKLGHKFHIWDEDIYPADYPDNPDSEKIMSVLSGEDWYWFENGDFELVQFIGLNDKNGKEIFEGDILNIPSGKNMKVDWSNKFASFVLNREGWAFSHWFGEAVNPEECEVIGNIFQNQELLQV